MNINKILHFGDQYAIFERNGIFSKNFKKVEFSKPEYDALVAQEQPKVKPTALCDYLLAANIKAHKDSTFGEVLNRYRTNDYTGCPYELSYNDMYIHGRVICENGNPVVIEANTDGNEYAIDIYDAAFTNNIDFLKKHKVITL